MTRFVLFLSTLAAACASAPPTAKSPSRPEPIPTAGETGAARLSAPTAVEKKSAACDALTIFELYEKNGAVVRRSAAELALHLPIDLHQADCGAPDCFGHDMWLSLRLGEEAGRCVILEAEASSTPFDSCGGPTQDPKPAPWRNSFVSAGRPDLADPALDRIELRDEARGHALVLLDDNYLFYEKVTREKNLLPKLVDFESSECCGGWAYSKTSEWSEPPEP
jgi:hypothetical protein